MLKQIGERFFLLQESLMILTEKDTIKFIRGEDVVPLPMLKIFYIINAIINM